MRTPLLPAQVLELVPQREPFRFIDEILELSEQGILGRVRFRDTEPFYRGHFPGHPITPGVILLEAMCQTGVVAHGIYLLSLEEEPAELRRWTTLFSDAQVEFLHPVPPGSRVRIRGERIFWRRRKLRSQLEMIAEDGTCIARAVASGMGVRNG